MLEFIALKVLRIVAPVSFLVLVKQGHARNVSFQTSIHEEQTQDQKKDQGQDDQHHLQG